ncbi:hypothetical protein IFM89_017825 [Coptis chinensis]|uniref:Ribosomal RNA-processing protein 7 C-terminal domain-containing protein n=1 Tax=Coptis chinensis TaxID=261450 RepID=A0A835H5Z4_9MAGN|nr:hypothetical protein IFM89_017825 [Coptis chinensis]
MAMLSDAKNQALSHTNDAIKIAEIHTEKVEFLFAELCHVKALLDSNVKLKSNESTKELNTEIWSCIISLIGLEQLLAGSLSTMDNGGGNTSRGIKHRNKLLENVTLVESHDENLMKEKKKRVSGKKRKNKNVSGADVDDTEGEPDSEMLKLLVIDEKSAEGNEEKKKSKKSRKKRKEQNASEADQLGYNGKDGNSQSEASKKKKSTRLQEADVEVNGTSVYNFNSSALLADKSKKAVKKKKKDLGSSEKSSNIINKGSGSVGSEVYHISSVDVDCSKGMRKWITNYYQSRPGLKILQERIDEFIISHEAQKEQARKEKEAEAADGGWTVVGQHKGRKKTTDAESGTTMGSVALAAVLEKMGKKKSNDVGLNFYKFQRKEAQRNEIMMLQSKFEQDKKRIQQLRAARKFRPY